ncbi:carbohydrate-binding family 9-like protein [Cohnella silvisoli]|uniref:Carbohydrate-binding family 9-like protein n=1 Tax=Cohnella silvisoli TaxID=2873699 RepID=A0ABV1L4J6_9BACL|nr:carbohydrate-binding family 9-like protein [Cohnella silvisoli]MCD9026249.1 carbohydrate-binding family 9-like protein [Cohnella silvisoli]
MGFSRPVYGCARREIGRFPGLRDEIWLSLPFMELKETESGGPPRLATAVQAYWSQDRSSICFRFVGADDGIVSTFLEHDDPLYMEDVIELFLSETGSMNRYKEFELSPANVKFDADIINDLKSDIQVNRSWHAAGWRTEFDIDQARSGFVSVWEIPFECFEVGCPSPDDRWTMNCYRIDRSERFGDEYSAWSPTGKINFHIPECFGWLLFEK